MNVGVDKPSGTQTCFGIRTAQPLGQPGIVWMHRPPARHHDPGPVGGTRWTSAWAPKGSTPNWSQSMHVRRRRTPSPTRWAKLDRASTAGPGPGPTPGRRLPPGGQHQRGGRGFGLLPPTRSLHGHTHGQAATARARGATRCTPRPPSPTQRTRREQRAAIDDARTLSRCDAREVSTYPRWGSDHCGRLGIDPQAASERASADGADREGPGDLEEHLSLIHISEPTRPY